MTSKNPPNCAHNRDAAIRYVEHGHRAVLLHEVLSGACSCGNSSKNCPSPSGRDSTAKHPRQAGWLKNLITNRSEAERAWGRYPTANVGLCPRQDEFVLDVDPRHGGDKTLAKLEALHGPLDGPCARTGGNGSHHWLKLPAGVDIDSVKSTIARNLKLAGGGIDLRTHRNQVVAEPSIHKSGGAYEWLDDRSVLDCEPCTPNDAWLEALGITQPNEDPARQPNQNHSSEINDDLERARWGLLTERLLNPDCGYEGWFRIGAALKPLGDEGLRLWLAASEPSVDFDVDEIQSKWPGMKGSSLGCLFGMFDDARPGWRGDWSRANRPHPRTSDPSSASKSTNSNASQPSGRSHAMPTTSVEELAADTTTQDWQIENWVYSGSLLLFAGQSGGGKSFLTLDICMRMRHGLDFHGHAMKPGSCVYFAGEGMGGIRKRIRSWNAQNCVVPDQSRYFRFVDGVPPLTTDEGRMMVHDTIADLTDRFGHAPAFVVIDTLSQAFGGADENDAKTVAPALKNAESVKLEFGSTVCCIHHIAKHIPTSQLNMDSIRGSGAFHGNVDAAWGLARTNTERVLKPLKQRDGADDDLQFSFDLLPVETGINLDSGDPEVSCVIRPFGTSAQTSAPDLRKFLADLLQTSALEGLTAAQALEATEEQGVEAGRTTVYKLLNDLSETPDFTAVGTTRIRYYAAEFDPKLRATTETSAQTSANVHPSESADEGDSPNVRPRRPPKGGGYADERDAQPAPEGDHDSQLGPENPASDLKSGGAA